MKPFPELWTVGLHTHTPGVRNDYGELIDVYTPPLEQPGAQHAVYGWAAPSSTEPKLSGHDRVVVEVELLAPPGFPAGAHDLIDLPDGQYEVIGQPEDFNHGPFGFTPGLVINLKRSTG